MLTGNDAFAPGTFRYKETGEAYRGRARLITLSDDVYYYAADGREIVPVENKLKHEPSEYDLFFNTSWVKL